MDNKYRCNDDSEQIAGFDLFYDDGRLSYPDVFNEGQTGINSLKQRVTLRLAVGADVRFIARLSCDVFKIYGPYEDILPEWFRSGNKVTTIIACQGKKQIGFAILCEPSDRYDLHGVSELLGIAVEPETQGKGVGRLLLKAVENKSESMGIEWVFLHTAVDNMQARRLYERAGYGNLEVKKGFYPGGQDAVVMYKSIAGNFE